MAFSCMKMGPVIKKADCLKERARGALNASQELPHFHAHHRGV